MIFLLNNLFWRIFLKKKKILSYKIAAFLNKGALIFLMKSILKKSYCAKKLTIYFLRNNWYVFHEQGLTCIRNENYFLIGSYCRTFLLYIQIKKPKMDVLQMTRKEKKINILAVKLRISQVIARLITVNSWGRRILFEVYSTVR